MFGESLRDEFGSGAFEGVSDLELVRRKVSLASSPFRGTKWELETHIGKVSPSGRDLPPLHLLLQQVPKDPLPLLQFLPGLEAPLGEPFDGPFDGALGGPGGTDLDAVEEFREL